MFYFRNFVEEILILTKNYFNDIVLLAVKRFRR